MNKTDIIRTLDALRNVINFQTEILEVPDHNIRIRIGKKLIEDIKICINTMYYINPMQTTTIFGYPVEIDYDKPMCLEVHIVESVPIYLESDI